VAADLPRHALGERVEAAAHGASPTDDKKFTFKTLFHTRMLLATG
jgi:hypothetical protein